MDKLRTFLTLLFCVFLTDMQAKGLHVDATTVNMQQGFYVTTETSLSIGWLLSTERNGASQTAYQYIVTDAITGRKVIDSKKVASCASQQIPVCLPCGMYNLSVRVWDERGDRSEWSIPQEVMIEIADAAFKDARWIGAITKADSKIPTGRGYTYEAMKDSAVKAAWAAVDSLSRRSIVLKRSFATSNAPIKKAVAHVCGLGFYEFSMNGHKVGDATMAPLWSDYDKSVFYNTYDVTGCLAQGDNTLEVLLGNGFYNEQGGRYHKLLISFGPPTLRLRLDIYYADGKSVQTIVSDGQWKYAESPITYNSIYGGEDYDARLEGADCLCPVVEQEAPNGIMRPQMGLPVKIMERYPVKDYRHLPDSALVSASKAMKHTVDPSAIVFDMGQNLAGFPEITVSGKRGQKVVIYVSETLNADGSCNQKQTGRPHYYIYTLKGEGKETWHPRFSYYGFQYIQVEGAVLPGEPNPRNLPVLDDLQSCFVYNSAKQVSSFDCSNDIINGTHRIIGKAVRSNWQSVWTDCPHREKLGWLEQDYLNGEALAFNYDLSGFLEQTMRNIADAQLPSGAMPTTAPEYLVFKGKWLDVFRESPEWGGALVYLPFLYRQQTGSDKLIKQYYPNMKRYVDYLDTRCENHILNLGLGDWYDYAPGRAGFARNTKVDLVATAHYYQWMRMTKEAALLVGEQTDATELTKRSETLAKAYAATFYDKDRRTFGTGSQASNAITMGCGLADVQRGEYEHALSSLVADIHAHGDRLTTGDVGNRFLFHALSENNMDTLLYKMINHYEVPGYGFQLKQGATTLSEQWDPREGASRNHFMMGQIDAWFFSALAGFEDLGNIICPVVTIRPRMMSDLTYVRATTNSLWGTVGVDWKRDGRNFTISVIIPVGQCAKVYLPGESTPHEVKAGKHTLTCELPDDATQWNLKYKHDEPKI